MSPDSSSDETLFAAALERPLAERASFLQQACGHDAAQRARIEALLLAHDDATTHFMATAAPAARLPEPGLGEAIGRYKLLQKIGEGGCGVVYMAEQEKPVRRRVALKVIKLGMDTKEVIARFEAERQALALMDHPNIARVFDAGATDAGRPFFVMELVRGVPITKFCDEQNLPTRARLELFTLACHAVQHAHQKGIIHRDIKPSNILVTLHDGVPVPKVIDFGIAKATHGRLTDNTLFTAFEQFIGTPTYMSPEQAEMSGLDIDTRSDTYSLGVLLYELLTGRPPFDPRTLVAAGLDEIRRIIREVEPPRPSAHVSTLNGADRATVAKLRGTDPAKLSLLISGDLDWIVMKAMEKNRERRYDTPSELAADIARHLGNEPVLARPPSSTYRLGKMVRRNKVAFAAGGAIAAALVIGLGVSTWMFFREKAAHERAVLAESEQSVQRHRADAARAEEALQRSLADGARSVAEANEKKAQSEAAISEAVSRFLMDDLLSQADSTRQIAANAEPNPDLTVREALDRAALKVGARFANQPLTEAAVRSSIGWAYFGVGEYAKAEVHFTRALELRKAALGPEHRDTLFSMRAVSNSMFSQRKFAEAAVLDEQLFEIKQRVFGPEHRETLYTMDDLANVYGGMGATDKSRRLRDKVFEVQKRTLGPDHPLTLNTMSNLASSYIHQGRVAEAEALATESLERRKRVLGPEDHKTLGTMQLLASVYATQGKPQAAIALQSQVLEIRKRILGPQHPDTIGSMVTLAALFHNQDRPAEAQPLWAQAWEMQKRTRGPEHPETLATMANLANTYSRLGRSAESRPLRDQLLQMQKRVLGAEHPNTLQTMMVLAQSYLNQGRHAEAAATGAEVLEIRRRVLGVEHADTLATMRSLAQIYREQGRQAEVVKLGAESLEIQRRVLGPTHPQTLTALQILARAQESTGDLVAAEALLRELQSLAPAHDSARSMLGLVLVKQGKFAEAETLLRPIQVARDAKQPDLWTTFVTRFSLGAALAGLGRNAEAEPLLVSGYEGLMQRIVTIPPVDQERLTEAFEQLDRFYVKSDQPGKAAVLRQGHDAHKHAQAGSDFERKGEFAKAIAEYLDATRLAPDLADAWNGLAWTRATAPDAAVRDGAAAVIAARKACELTGWKHLGHIDTLAAAHAEAGEFDSAVKFQQKSLDLLGADHPQRNEWLERLALYRDRKPYRQPERTASTAK